MENTKLLRTCIDGDPHTLVLRRMPTESSTLDLLFDAVAPERPTDALAVTDDGTEGFLEAWCSQTTRRPRNIGMISVDEQMRSSAAMAAPQHDIVQGVADPTDTEAIRNAATRYLDIWPTDGRTVVYFDSMASVLDQLGPEETVDFLQEFIRTLDARNAVGYFCLAPENHDEEVVREVASLFDTVVECVGSAAKTIVEPSVSDCFDAISNPRRRYLLAAILEQASGSERNSISDSDSISVDALADVIGARSLAEREQIHLSLVNVHLPKLADLGMVDYDRNAEGVGPGRHFGRVEPYLRKAMELEGSEESERSE